jgi:hypothetical protein
MIIYKFVGAVVSANCNTGIQKLVAMIMNADLYKF